MSQILEQSAVFEFTEDPRYDNKIYITRFLAEPKELPATMNPITSITFEEVKHWSTF